MAKHSKPSKDFIEDIMRFYKLASPTMFDFVSKLKGKEKTDFFNEMHSNSWVPIHQPPFYDNITIDAMKKLYNEEFTEIEKVKFVGIDRPLVLGDIYYLKLKHMPKSKFSVRSAGMTDLIDVPYRNNEAYKRHTAMFNSNALRMGEQEWFVMSLLENPEGVNKFFKCYSSSKSDRESMISQLFDKDISDIDSFTNDLEENSVSNPARVVRAMFAGIGLNLKTSEDK